MNRLCDFRRRNYLFIQTHMHVTFDIKSDVVERKGQVCMQSLSAEVWPSNSKYDTNTLMIIYNRVILNY